MNLMKKFLPPFFCLLQLLLTGCNTSGQMDDIAIPESVTIEGVTYRNGFYGELYPLFGQVGDIGSVTLQEEILYDDEGHEFQRVYYKGHDWIHSEEGELGGGIVYCAESQWEQMCDYYADPVNFEYYCGLGHYMVETSVVLNISEIDLQKFDELLTFGNENQYNPFDKRSNKKIMEKTRRLPEAEYQGGLCFYRESKDGYFTTMKDSMYFIHDDRLLLVFYHDGGRLNGGNKEVLVIDVPDELGQYFINLMEPYDES